VAEKPFVSVIVPVRNAGRTIKTTFDYLMEIEYPRDKMEIVLADGGSSDNTVEIIKEYQKDNPFIKLVEIPDCPSPGYARTQALKQAKGEIIVTGDADGTYPFNKIPYFLELIEKESLDFINTNRFGMMRDGSMSFLHKFGNGVLTLWFNILFSNKIKDSQSGMWIFRKKVIDKLNFDIMDGGMPFSQEIKAFACLYGFNVKEIPIEYRSRIGKAKLNTFKDGFRNLYKLFVFKAKLLKLK
jgi:glycosyltransferase involved in cell wall biosynthesis